MVKCKKFKFVSPTIAWKTTYRRLLMKTKKKKASLVSMKFLRTSVSSTWSMHGSLRWKIVSEVEFEGSPWCCNLVSASTINRCLFWYLIVEYNQSHYDIWQVTANAYIRQLELEERTWTAIWWRKNKRNIDEACFKFCYWLILNHWLEYVVMFL